MLFQHSHGDFSVLTTWMYSLHASQQDCPHKEGSVPVDLDWIVGKGNVVVYQAVWPIWKEARW